MIPLSKRDAPVELDDNKIAELSDLFVRTGEAVWNQTYIRSGLLDDSHGKCAYCEAKLTEESKYLEVDHFRCKSNYPHLVVRWGNLIPSCKRCNVRKSNHDVDTEGMIVNPFDSAPKDHLYLLNYRLRYRTPIGKSTVETLYLNQSDRLVAVRMMIGNGVSNALDDIRQKLDDYLIDIINRKKLRRVQRGIEALLLQAAPSAEYSATTATTLLNDPDYIWIKDKFIELGIWDQFSELELVAQTCAL